MKNFFTGVLQGGQLVPVSVIVVAQKKHLGKRKNNIAFAHLVSPSFKILGAFWAIWVRGFFAALLGKEAFVIFPRCFRVGIDCECRKSDFCFPYSKKKRKKIKPIYKKFSFQLGIKKFEVKAGS